jgi:hypothetical protein
LAHPDAAADQRLLNAFMGGCGMDALRRLDASFAREIPYTVLSQADGQARMVADAAAFDADINRCFDSLHARGRVTWQVGARELDAQAIAVEVASVMSYPEGHTTNWTGLGAGCGSRGGPGYRLASGQCASWSN